MVVALLISNCSKDEDPITTAGGGGGGGGGGDSCETEFLASMEPEKRKVVLEDFTGVRCGYCPDGHLRAKAFSDANPGNVFIVAVHSGSYAKPASGWANFTNSTADAINQQAYPIGYPAGTVNRIKFDKYLQKSQSGAVSKLAMSRGSWATAGGEVLAMSAPVNLGSKATYNEATRELTVKVDLYYTAEETETNNLSVFLLQDGLVSKQSGGGDNYVQNHVLRTSINGSWGDPIVEETKVGSKVSKVYTYTLPEDYNGTGVTGGGAVVVEDLEIVSFVSRGQLEILNATSTTIK